MAADAFIQCRVPSSMKAALRAAAQRQQVSESVLLKRLLDVLIGGSASEAVAPSTDASAARDARLYVRLTAEDRALLRERASGRGIPSATYISVLVRSHLRELAPLPKQELAALRRSVAELGAIGRNLNQIARSANKGGRITAPGRDDLHSMLKVCEGLRDHVRALIKANLISWQTGHAEKDV